MMRLFIHPEVQDALMRKKAIVALESTILSHGMPYPDNIAMSKQVSSTIRQAGAIPATIAVLDGRLKVGLTPEEIERLAKGEKVMKLSKRDLAFAVSEGQTGATTVSATMLLAHQAGIPIFATGGIGGVHRGASQSFDISRDLEELANCPVTVVCAGAKVILDLGLTLEYLETKGVEVIGYQTDFLPAFYSRESAYRLEYRLETPKAVARFMRTKQRLGFSTGTVIANPIPHDAALPYVAMETHIENALMAASEAGISGKQVTPFLLTALKEKTQGASLEANIALMLNNAKLAAEIAVQYWKM
ncbi:MAG: pseudouridine-5'-phosphate glycosidase [Acholeplasmatales bacterium]|nr:MAG: pseudouridine-5'-phosphate glycosidase [Acholeplasmatales bacterium]